MARRRDPEGQLQRSIVEWLGWAVPPHPLGPWWTAVNPVSFKSEAVAGKSKAMGMKPGVPDMVFVWRGRPIWVELKAPKGTVTTVQEQVHEAITVCGGVVAVVRSIDQLAGLFETVGIPMRARAA